MKSKVVKFLPFLLLAIAMFVMYGTNIGIPGITQYWGDFKLLDMQPFYGIDTVTTMLYNIGDDGVRHYLYYFAVDFVFIIVLFWVQLEISKSVLCHRKTMYKVLVACVVARGVFDLLEDLLLSLIITKRLPISMVPLASHITGLKFLCLIFWSIMLLISIFYLMTDKRKNTSV